METYVVAVPKISNFGIYTKIHILRFKRKDSKFDDFGRWIEFIGPSFCHKAKENVPQLETKIELVFGLNGQKMINFHFFWEKGVCIV